MPRSLADFVREALEVVEEISPEGAAQILEKPERADWDFIDVREPDEFAAGHIPGARNYPRGFLKCAPTSSTPNATRGSKIGDAR